MFNKVIIIVLTTILVIGLGWLMNFLRVRLQEVIHRRRVIKWLQHNTKDEPGASHKNTKTIAKETGMLEERVHRACMSHKGIYRFNGPPEQWSVWREEPQSIYETRGLLKL